MPPVVLHPGILGGDTPVIYGTRVPAKTIVAEIVAGNATAEIVRRYPTVDAKGIEAAWAWHRDGCPTPSVVEAPCHRKRHKKH